MKNVYTFRVTQSTLGPMGENRTGRRHVASEFERSNKQCRQRIELILRMAAS